MTPFPLFILAQNSGNWSDLIVFAVVILVSVIGALSKWWERKQEERGRNTGPSGQGASTRERLKKLAEQRRRQLQEMAEGGDRGRATARPETRSAEPRADEPVFDLEPEPQPVPATPSPAERARAEARRKAAERQRRQQAERKTARRRRRRDEQQQRRELDRQRRLARRTRRGRAAPSAAEADRQISADRMEAEIGQPGHRGEGVHRHVSNAAATGAYALSAETPASVIGRNLSREKLREAILLKEILDKPVALRDPLDLPMNR